MPLTPRRMSLVESRGSGDTITAEYLIDLGQIPANAKHAATIAHAMGLPSTRQNLPGTTLFVDTVNGDHTPERRDHWVFVVNYTQLPAGESEEQQNENPLLRPPVVGVKYLDKEYVVKKARNVVALGAEFAAGGPYRAAGTLGPITNGAGKRPDEPIVRTERVGLITIEKNYANLGQIMRINRIFKRSTNSDSVTFDGESFIARQLKYEATHEGGRQTQNGYVFYPGTTEIAIEETTDLILDNVGFEYYSAGAELKRALDEDGEPTAEPVNLNLNGTLLEGSTATQLVYRDLTEMAYSVFFS